MIGRQASTIRPNARSGLIDRRSSYVAPKRAPTAFGIMNLAFAISGFLAPVITGSVLKLHGSFVDAFWLMAGLAFSSVIVVLIFHHPDRDRPKPMLEL